MVLLFDLSFCLQVLLSQGADLSRVDKEGLTARELLSTKKKGSASPVIMGLLDQAQAGR